MTRADVDEFVTGFLGVWMDRPFGEDTAVYKIGIKDDGEGKMFVLVDEKSDPLKVSMKCDPSLAEILREKYETVLPGYHLNKKHWNTILFTGQIPDDELRDLMRHSFELVKE